MTSAQSLPQPGRSGAPSPVAHLAWEHTHREFLAAVLFKRKIEAMGLVANLSHITQVQTTGKRPVVFMPFYYDDQDRLAYLRHGWRNRWIVNLCYEQMHFDCGRGYLLPDGAFARDEMLHCAWGPRFADLLVAHGIPAERVRMTGHLRFDLYHHPELLWSRADLAKRYGLDPGRQWLLVPYNFNMAYVTPDVVQYLMARGYALTPDFLHGVARARDEMTALLRVLADRFPELEIILRVHPAGFEAEDLYRAEGQKRPNLHVIAEYDIANWISQAALTIVWNSTSAMEAMVAGRPVIAFEPFPFASVYGYDVNRIVPSFSTVDEVVAVVESLPDAQLHYDWALFETWYAHRDGGNVDRLAAVVAEAAGHWDRFVCRAVEPTLKVAMRGLAQRWQAAPDVSRSPPPAALAATVATLRPEPLQDFLK